MTRERATVITKDIEAERMRREVTPDLEVISFPWTATLEDAVGRIAPGTLGADLPFARAVDLGDEVAVLRRNLDPDAIARYPAIGTAASAAIDEAAAVVTDGLTEHQVAAELVAAAGRRELHAAVAIVAADERIALYRHPMPVGQVIKHRCMLVLSAERGGLHASVTRFVDLTPPDSGTAERMRICLQLGEAMRAATRPGRSLAEVFSDITRLYVEAGHADAWRAHHQGGVTGYAGREELATPGSQHLIAAGQAFAWNPSLRGAKSEETFLLLESGPHVIAG